MWHSTGVDTDAYSAANAARWERLAALSKKRGLSGAEADELAAMIRRETIAMPDPDPVTMFDHVYVEPDPMVERQRAQFAEYTASFEGEN